jgi:hypothetical protein
MTFDWRTYKPRKTRNGFETMRLYCNFAVLVIAVAFTFLVTVLMAGCARDAQTFLRIQW